MAKHAALLPWLLLIGCSVESGEPSSALGTLCGWERQKTITLSQLAPCWELQSSGDCIAVDPAISSACDLPDEPQRQWLAGERVTLWCSVLQAGRARSDMVPSECR